MSHLCLLYLFNLGPSLLERDHASHAPNWQIHTGHNASLGYAPLLMGRQTWNGIPFSLGDHLLLYNV